LIEKQQFSGKVVLITGASSGIGEALAEAFAVQGATLVLAARRLKLLNDIAQRLRNSYSITVHVHACDVTQDQSIQLLIADLQQQQLPLDVVVANAGFGVVGAFDRLSLGDYQRQFDTNVYGVIRTVHATLPLLRRSRGVLAIMGSVVGHVAQPGASAYAMSKFAVRALAESLRAELAADGVAVTLLSPGVVESNLRRVDNQGVFHSDAPEPFPAWLRMPTQRAAKQMLRAIHRRKAEQVITLHAKVAILLSRYAPGVLRFVFRRGLRARPTIGPTVGKSS
jgi:short-subunit dehydrogenase